MWAVGIIAWVLIGAGVGVLGYYPVAGGLGMAPQEGYLAMMSVVVGGPMGMVAGAAFAVWVLRKLEGETKQKRFVGFSTLAVIALVGGFVAMGPK